MTANADPDQHRKASETKPKGLNEEEPWPIWAAIMVYLNVLVIAGQFYGLAGLVTVAVPAAILMLVVLLLIVRG